MNEAVKGPVGSAGKERRSEVFTLPNLLSLSRILLTPVFVWMMVQKRPWAAFIVFLAAGATDALDGFTARMLHLKSTLGLWLDPVGDKVLLTSAFVVLTLPALGPAQHPAFVADWDLHRPGRRHRPGRALPHRPPGKTDVHAGSRRQGQHGLSGPRPLLRPLLQRRGPLAPSPGLALRPDGLAHMCLLDPVCVSGGSPCSADAERERHAPLDATTALRPRPLSWLFSRSRAKIPSMYPPRGVPA